MVNGVLKTTSTNTYDANGNLKTSTDALSKQTVYNYYSTGLPQDVTDPTQAKTQFFYNSAGNLTQQTDALNHVSTYTYDGNGNKKSQTVTRVVNGVTETLTTNYDYDNQNRLLKTRYPDTTFTRVEYNSIGKQSATYDPLNHKTSYDYDDMGQLTKVTYAEQTFESYNFCSVQGSSRPPS